VCVCACVCVCVYSTCAQTCMYVSITVLSMIVCLPIPTGCPFTVHRAFYGLILPDGFSKPLLCVRNSIFITNPTSKTGWVHTVGNLTVIAKWRDWFSLLTTLLDKIVLWPPFGQDVLFYYCFITKGNWKLSEVAGHSLLMWLWVWKRK